MENLPKDLIMSITLEYDMPTILSTCLTSKRMKEVICDNETFWMNKVRRDYPETFNNLVKKENLGKFSWKSLYNRRYKIERGKAKIVLAYREIIAPMMKANEWNNASGMPYNNMRGWSLRRDKKSQTFYLYPSTYSSLYGPKPKEGENHPLHLIRIEFSPKPILTKIPWDENLLGEEVSYRRDDGKVSWYDDLYTNKFEFDGGNYIVNTYLLLF